MESLKELYKIGYGPSSSHTMGPERASKLFRTKYPKALKYKVILYGSLSLTGKGHLTDYIIKKTLGNVDVVFSNEYLEYHPNGMDLFAYLEEEVVSWRVYSIGGGNIVIEGEEMLSPKKIYPHSTFNDIKEYCEKKNIRIWEYVEEVEGKEIWSFLALVWKIMNESITKGFSEEGLLPGELKVERKAKTLLDKIFQKEPKEITESRVVSAYAFAVSETNASGGLVVTAPTCGASGVLPSVLKYMQKRYDFSDEDILKALATAGIIGNIIKTNATISGAEAGCQAEVGSACSMAAAAHSELFNLNLGQIEYAAEIAMEHHLGLTCDPIKGYVQIPCIERNAVAALRAIDACGLAFFLSESRKISFDMVVETMYRTGKDLHANYRETSGGGLADLYK